MLDSSFWRNIKFYPRILCRVKASIEKRALVKVFSSWSKQNQSPAHLPWRILIISKKMLQQTSYLNLKCWKISSLSLGMTPVHLLSSFSTLYWRSWPEQHIKKKNLKQNSWKWNNKTVITHGTMIFICGKSKKMYH